ncbi:Hypothetical_protein [Hexamita inflata]|uniref:Hypothetical_protein n=1 Tax=Hexamita inflata TaxID=28002 RepID=A0AA86PQ18_9EUKA|nr:Hypothetical protein HINF_LOCUS28958 [Hexamita inflata]CAI9970266.1 Hypothetical protein HINF_LOCUS57911 [Hexamita inflata]
MTDQQQNPNSDKLGEQSPNNEQIPAPAAPVIQDQNLNKQEYKFRPISPKPLRVTYNILNAIYSVAQMVAVSDRFIQSNFRLNDFCYTIFVVLFSIANMLRSVGQIFVRHDFGFFYDNKRRGFVCLAFSFLVLPDFNSFSTLIISNIFGIIAIAVSAILFIFGFFVVDMEDRELRDLGLMNYIKVQE